MVNLILNKEQLHNTQTVQSLLNQFNLKLDLSSQCLSIEIEGEFYSCEIMFETYVLLANIQNIISGGMFFYG